MIIYIAFAFVLGLVMALVGVQYYVSPTEPRVTDLATTTPRPDTPPVVTSTDEGSTTDSGRQVQIYDGILVSEQATELDLSDRNLTGSLQAEIRLLAAIETINLSGNQFTGLPAEIGQLHELRILNLANNNLTGLPHELGNLQKLTLLDVRGNPVSTADMEIIVSRLPVTTEVLR